MGKKNIMRTAFKKRRLKQRGFTLIEMMVATLVLMIGLVGVAQLVPAAIRLNTANREDSTELVVAQSYMNQFIQQPLASAAYVDALGNNCTISGPALAFAGSPVVPFRGNPVINFAAGQVAGFSLNYRDPNDPVGITYDVRWAVFTLAGNGGKRFIVGARRVGGNNPLIPVNLDSMVTK